MTNHIALNAGYEALWLNGVALGADAAARSLLNPSLLRTVSRGKISYQGATVGIDFTW